MCWGQLKAILKCSVFHTMPQKSQVLRECAIGMLTAGMSTRTVTRELNVHFNNIERLQCRFREFGSTSNRPQNHRPRVNARPSTSGFFYLRDHLRQPPRQLMTLWVCTSKELLHKLSEIISEAHLRARHPHPGLDLTAVLVS